MKRERKREREETQKMKDVLKQARLDGLEECIVLLYNKTSAVENVPLLKISGKTCKTKCWEILRKDKQN